MSEQREWAITDEMKTGWNACRRQVYLLAEHEQDKGPYSADTSDFARGYKYMAKSFAKAFNAFEADDCDFLREAALVPPAASAEAVGLHDDISLIAVHLNCEPDVDSILHTIREIQADLDIAKDKVAELSTLPIPASAEAVSWYIPKSPIAITRDIDVTDRWRLANSEADIRPLYATPPDATATIAALEGKVARLRKALQRLVDLTPQRANARDAMDLHLTVRAIAETALGRAVLSDTAKGGA